MLLLAFFIVGSSIYRGLLNYLALNGWLSILLVVGVLLGNSVLLLLAVYGKIGYYPFLLVLSFLYYCSSYAFVLFDLANKLSYFTSLVTIGNASIYLCTFDLWLVLVNLLAAAVFIKFMVAIKHAVFISSLIFFALAYLLLFLQDLLYTLAVILLYLLFSINAIGQLAAMKAEAAPGNLTNQLLLFTDLSYEHRTNSHSSLDPTTNAMLKIVNVVNARAEPQHIHYCSNTNGPLFFSASLVQ